MADSIVFDPKTVPDTLSALRGGSALTGRSVSFDLWITVCAPCSA
jgi:hypothetical protein